MTVAPPAQALDALLADLAGGFQDLCGVLRAQLAERDLIIAEREAQIRELEVRLDERRQMFAPEPDPLKVPPSKQSVTTSEICPSCGKPWEWTHQRWNHRTPDFCPACLSIKRRQLCQDRAGFQKPVAEDVT